MPLIAPLSPALVDPDEFQKPLRPIASARLDARDWLIAALVALLAMLICAALGGRRGFWLDEYYTLHAARLSFQEMVIDRLGAGHSPVYFLYARLGFLAGQGEAALRLSSALALGATILLLTGLAGAMGLRRRLPALWAISLFHPYWITAGTEFRYMMPVIALTAAAAWAAFDYARAWRWRPGLALAAALGLLLWVHGSAQFIALGLLGFVLWEGRARAGRWSRTVFWRAWPVLVGLAASAPLLFLVRHHESESKQRDLVHLWELVKDLNEVVFNLNEYWTRALTRHNVDALILLPCVALLGAGIWLARRELLRHGRTTAWRLLGALLLGIPLAQTVITTFVRRVQGPSRYVAAFSAPATLCLALAWSAALPRRWRAPWRVALAFFLGLQWLAGAWDLGDLHREGIRWLLSQHHGEKILISTRAMNRLAFEYLSGKPVEKLVTLGDADLTSKDAVLARIRQLYAAERRGFIFLYHDGEKLHRRIKDLKAEGFFVEVKTIPVCGNVRIYAFIRDAAERPWLDALPPFTRPWGPARGDSEDYPER